MDFFLKIHSHSKYLLYYSLYIHYTIHGIFSWNRPVFVYQAMAAKRPQWMSRGGPSSCPIQDVETVWRLVTGEMKMGKRQEKAGQGRTRQNHIAFEGENMDETCWWTMKKNKFGINLFENPQYNHNIQIFRCVTPRSIFMGLISQLEFRNAMDLMIYRCWLEDVFRVFLGVHPSFYWFVGESSNLTYEWAT